MTQEHPTIPPLPLTQQWIEFAGLVGINEQQLVQLATQAARWGADQELEACCEWVSQWRCMVGGNRPELGLRAARRPKPLSLKEQALEALDQADKGLNESEWQQRSDTIRRALESLP